MINIFANYKIVIPIIVILILFILSIIKKRSIANIMIHLDVVKLIRLIPIPLRPSVVMVEIPIFVILLILVIFRFNSFSNIYEIFAIMFFAIIINLILMPIYSKFTQ